MDNRERRKNFTSFEKEVLLELVAKYQSVLENKLTSAAVNREKSEAWDKIAEEFNGTPGTAKRSTKQLLDCHRNFKKRTPKNLVEEKMLDFKTGPVVLTISPLEEKVFPLGMTKQMLINAVDGDVPVNVRNPGETAVPTDDLRLVETIVPTNDLHSLVEREESQKVKQEVVENIPLASTINSPPPPPQVTPVTEATPKAGPSRNLQDHQPRQWRPHQKKRRICANASWEKALDERRKDEIKESELRMQLLEERHREEQRRLEEKHMEEQRRSEEKHREEQRRLEEIHQIELQLRENKKWLLDLQIAEFEKKGR